MSREEMQLSRLIVRARPLSHWLLVARSLMQSPFAGTQRPGSMVENLAMTLLQSLEYARCWAGVWLCDLGFWL